MQTLPANNPDAKGPDREDVLEMIDRDLNRHDPQKRVITDTDRDRLDVHGGPTNREDQSTVEAAEGEIRSTPQGP